MIVIVRDTWRAVLVLVVGVLLMEIGEAKFRQPPTVATPTVGTQMMMPPPPVAWMALPPAPPERPLRRVAAAIMELGDSALGVVR